MKFYMFWNSTGVFCSVLFIFFCILYQFSDDGADARSFSSLSCIVLFCFTEGLAYVELHDPY